MKNFLTATAVLLLLACSSSCRAPRKGELSGLLINKHLDAAIYRATVEPIGIASEPGGADVLVLETKGGDGFAAGRYGIALPADWSERVCAC